MKLLSELQTIYPIERLDSGEYAIRGVELPVDHKYVTVLCGCVAVWDRPARFAYPFLVMTSCVLCEEFSELSIPIYMYYDCGR